MLKNGLRFHRGNPTDKTVVHRMNRFRQSLFLMAGKGDHQIILPRPCQGTNSMGPQKKSRGVRVLQGQSK